MAELYALTEEDLKTLKELVDAHRNQTIKARINYVDENEYTSSEVYIARIPRGGLAALALNTTGTSSADYADDYVSSAECQIYRISNNYLVAITGLKKTVWNLSNVTLSEGALVTIFKDKFGDWIIPNIGLEFGVC